MFFFNLLLKVFFCPFRRFIFVSLHSVTMNSLLNVAVSLNTSRSHCSREHEGNILSMQTSHFICDLVILNFTCCVCVYVYNNLIYGTMLYFSGISWSRNCDQWLRTETWDSSWLHLTLAHVSKYIHHLITAESYLVDSLSSCFVSFFLFSLHCSR